MNKPEYSILLKERHQVRERICLELNKGKEIEEGDTVGGMIKIVASEAAGMGFDEGVKFMESMQSSYKPANQQ